ncbi:MAG: response regulator [Thermoplasmata archaeon]
MDDRAFKILVVDDDAQMRALLKLTLEGTKEFECSVATSEDGKEALELLRKKNGFDMVISDYKMDNIDGLELLTTIREEFPDIIRVMITAYSQLNLAKDAINKAMVHNYIEKPWNQKDLRKTVFDLLNEEQNQRHNDKLELERGNVYLFLESGTRVAMETCLKRMEEHEGGIVITREPLNKLQPTFDIDLEKIKHYWLTKMMGSGNLNPVDLELIADMMIRFYENNGDTVLLEGVDALLRENSHNRFIGFLDNLIDVVSMTDGILVMSLNPRTVSEQELNLIDQKTITYKI